MNHQRITKLVCFSFHPLLNNVSLVSMSRTQNFILTFALDDAVETDFAEFSDAFP